MRLVQPFSGLEEIVQENASLRPHTWYRIGGNAQYLIEPASNQQLALAVLRCAENSIPLRVLGLGANLLVKDEGIDGAVFRLQHESFSQFEIEGNIVRAGAGVFLAKLINETIRSNLAGLEILAGIPATIGGAIRMNAGGRHGEIGTFVRDVTVMDTDGNIDQLSHEEINFEYRTCDISAPFILSATFELDEEPCEEITKRFKEIWMYKRTTQPLNAKSCGCVFRNPPGTSAGLLIDRAGLKGMAVGKAHVSTKHANFIVADENCSSDDVLKLIKLVQEKVEQSAGIVLETEVKVWP